MGSIEKRLSEAEAKAARLAPPDLSGCDWDLTQITDAELATLRDLAAKAARPRKVLSEQFDHARFRQLYEETRRRGPCPKCGYRPEQKPPTAGEARQEI